MPVRRAFFSFAGVAMLAVATAGCSGNALLDSRSYEGMFSKPMNVFTSREDGSKATAGNVVNLGPSGPVAPDELVGADGRCAPPASAVAAAPPPPPTPAPAAADRPVGSMAGDLAGAPMPQAVTPIAAQDPVVDPAAPQVVGGIALGMTECDAVRRAGLASNVSIGVGDKNERRVVLTYLGGTWPGIYTFQSGRLKEIARAPEQPKPKAVPKKKRPVAKKPVKKPVTSRAAPAAGAPTVIR